MGEETAVDDHRGCTTCRSWASGFGTAFKQEPKLSTNGAFRIVGEYFHAELVPCEICGTSWLRGYIEDFSGRPIEAEWGHRWWTMRALTPSMLEEIESARETKSLDLKAFAAHRPGHSWEQ